MARYAASYSANARPVFARQRSNSLPCFALVNVSESEATVLISAANQATAARRRRPASVDSPEPVTRTRFHPTLNPQANFHFSTPSRQGFASSSERHATRPSTSSTTSTQHSGHDEITPVDRTKPLPPLPLNLARNGPAVQSDFHPHFTLPPSPPHTSRRQVSDPSLKAYADSLFSFTQSRLNTATPENLHLLGLPSEIYLNECPPLTPELDQDSGVEVSEMRFQRPVLQSHFSDWSGFAEEPDAEDSYPPEPRTPDEEIGMTTPGSFFNVERTPRVVQRSHWSTLSSARPSSNAAAVSPFRSTTHPIPTTSSTSESCYFADFDSVTAALETQTIFDVSPLEESVPFSYAHARFQLPNRANDSPSPTRTQQPSFLSNSGPCTPLDDLSHPPTWLLRAIC